MPDDLWKEFEATKPVSEAGAMVAFMGNSLLDELISAHQESPDLAMSMLSVEIPAEVLKSIIFVALSRLDK